MIAAVLRAFDGFDVLHKQLKTVFIQSFIQPADPFHLAFVLHHIVIAGVVYPDPVPALVFGDKTRGIGGA